MIDQTDELLKKERPLLLKPKKVSFTDKNGKVVVFEGDDADSFARALENPAQVSSEFKLAAKAKRIPKLLKDENEPN